MTDTTPLDDPQDAAGDAQDDAGAQQAPGDQDDAVDAAGDAGDAHDQEDAQPTDAAARASREAARYRVALRDTEAQRDAMADLVETYQRREVERLAADRLAQAEDLLVYGNCALSDYLDDDGMIRPDVVNAALDDLLEDRPGLGKMTPARRGPSASGLGQHGSHGSGRTTWGEFLNNR